MSSPVQKLARKLSVFLLQSATWISERMPMKQVKMCEDTKRNGHVEIVYELNKNGHTMVLGGQNGHVTPYHASRHKFSIKRSMKRSPSVASRTGELRSHRIFLTICVYVTFFGLGLVGSVGGLTIVHMQYLLDTDIKGMTLTFVCQRIGYLLGVVISGALFDRLNQELQFAVACLVEGLAVVLAPFSPHLYGYYAAMATQAMAHGYINTGLQSFLLSLWEGKKYKNPITQGCPAVWSIGAAICPFIIRPFLVNIPGADKEIENITLHSQLTSEGYSFNVTDEAVLYDKIERVRYPYIIVGSNFAALSILYMIAYMMLGPECDRKVIQSKKQHQKRSGDTPAFRFPLLAMLFFFFMFHAWYEGIFSGLLTAFVIEGLDWPVSTGPLITFVFFSAHALGRLLGIPISVLISSTKMLTTSVLFTTLAFVLMLFIPNNGQILMWAGTALAGFAMATTYASTVLWSSKYITITGAAGAVFLLGGSTGGMTGGALIGWLFQTQTFMWVIYMALAACIIHIALIFTMFVFASCHKKKEEAIKNKLPITATTHIVQTLDMNEITTPVTSV